MTLASLSIETKDADKNEAVATLSINDPLARGEQQKPPRKLTILLNCPGDHGSAKVFTELQDNTVLKELSLVHKQGVSLISPCTSPWISLHIPAPPLHLPTPPCNSHTSPCISLSLVHKQCVVVLLVLLRI